MILRSIRVNFVDYWDYGFLVVNSNTSRKRCYVSYSIVTRSREPSHCLMRFCMSEFCYCYCKRNERLEIKSFPNRRTDQTRGESKSIPLPILTLVDTLWGSGCTTTDDRLWKSWQPILWIECRRGTLDQDWDLEQYNTDRFLLITLFLSDPPSYFRIGTSPS